MEIYWLGRTGYRETWALQEQIRQRVQQGGPDTLLLCEHAPVITLGSSASSSDIFLDEATLLAQGVECVRTSRGGKVTYHGPGQLVVYPVVRLRRGVLAHVQWLADAAIAVAGALGVRAEFSRSQVGVWARGCKLAAIGVHVSHRVAIHGLALNVTAESTAPFRRGWFVPCGEAAAQTTSLAEELLPEPAGERAAMASVMSAMASALCHLAGSAAMPVQRATVSLLSQGPLVK